VATSELEVVVSSAVGCVLTPSGNDPLGLKGFVLPPKLSPSTSGLRTVTVHKDGLNHEWMTFDQLPGGGGGLEGEAGGGGGVEASMAALLEADAASTALLGLPGSSSGAASAGAPAPPLAPPPLVVGTAVTVPSMAVYGMAPQLTVPAVAAAVAPEAPAVSHL
jgi:hypothetical protein